MPTPCQCQATTCQEVRKLLFLQQRTGTLVRLEYGANLALSSKQERRPNDAFALVLIALLRRQIGHVNAHLSDLRML